MLNLPKSLLAALLLDTIAFPVYADDHVVVQRARSGMGIRFPQTVTEVWISDSATCVNAGRFVTIERYDLRKRWRLAPQKKQYFEEPLVSSKKKNVEIDTSIQRKGWEYEPAYEWLVTESQRQDVVNGFHCSLMIVDGDADYSTDSLEIWLTDEVPIDIKRFNERMVSASVYFDWRKVVPAGPSLKKSFIMKCLDKQIPPIGAEMISESQVKTVENGTPPSNIYEIPEGFQKVGSSEELMR
ncbi:MAG: hypothetical protein WBD36_16030 [Bacteroidota bacterium]